MRLIHLNVNRIFYPLILVKMAETEKPYRVGIILNFFIMKIERLSSAMSLNTKFMVAAGCNCNCCCNDQQL